MSSDSMTTAAADILADLLEAEEWEAAEKAKLMADARLHVFGEKGCPVLSLDDTLGRVWDQWLACCELVNSWERTYDREIAGAQERLARIPKGRDWKTRSRTERNTVADFQWRRGAARHVLYCDYPDAQVALHDLLRHCWEESGVTTGEIFYRLDEFSILCTERRVREWANDLTLRELAAKVAADDD